MTHVASPSTDLQARAARARVAGKVIGVTGSVGKTSTKEALFAALNRSQAVIAFRSDGTILDANDNFLQTVGYPLNAIRGQHHRMFVEEAEQESPAYRGFWAALARGEYQSAEYKRVAKGGREVWIQASYNPIMGPGGKPVKVVKFATDITAQKLFSMDAQSKLAALDRSQAVIEFTPDGTILTANTNFLGALGYRLEEIQGQHHRLFVDPAEREGSEYRAFWVALGRGEF